MSSPSLGDDDFDVPSFDDELSFAPPPSSPPPTSAVSPSAELQDSTVSFLQLQQSAQPQQQQQPKPAVKKTRKKKDPNAPASVSSAYAFFFKETQASVKTHNPNAKFGEVSKIVASMWDALGEEDRSVYKKRNEEDKLRYEREMAEYRARQCEGASEAGGETAAHGKKGGNMRKKSTTTATIDDHEDEEEEEDVPEENRCIRHGCCRRAVKNSEWEDEYCSNECVVGHCGNVFADWVVAGGAN